MKYLKYFKIFESKNIQNLYHIVDIEKLLYILEQNKITSFKFSKISTTRNKMMNRYLGDKPSSIFKIELDGSKLSNHYKMKSYQDRYKMGSDYFYYNEWEEQIQTDEIKNVSKYIIKIILIKNRIENLKDSAWFEKHFNSEYKYKNLPELLKNIIVKYKIDFWVQDGSIIKKDDDYINSIINYELREKYHGYALYYRGLKKRKDRGYDETTIALDERNNDIKNLVVGYTYDDIWIKNDTKYININKPPSELENVTLNIFDFEYSKNDIIKYDGDFILINNGKLCDIIPIN